MAIVKKHFFILLLIFLIGVFFRFYNVTSNPPGLYWDETAFGYDAYSVLKTGMDHHGRFMPLFFESFGDWKLPIYFYLLVPSIAVFGLNEFAVRFPSALFGSLTIFVIFYLAREITKNNKVAYLCAFFLAISPWHIQFSRAGFESIPGLFFFSLALVLLLRNINKPKLPQLFFSAVLFALSIYSYHAYRIFTPLVLVALLLLKWKEISKNLKLFAVASLILGLILIPMFLFTLTSQGRTRAISQSVFKNNEFEQARVSYDQMSKKPFRFLSGYLFQQPLFYTYVATKSYLSHFSPVFLYFQGDQIGRHSQVDMGQEYSFEILLVVIAFFVIRSIPKEGTKILLTLLLLSPLPASIVIQAPHAYRTLQMVIPLAIINGIGANYLFFQQKSLLVKLASVLIIIFSILTFSNMLFVHYPKKFAADWQDGYKQMVIQIAKYQNNFDKIYISDSFQVPYIYLLFYQAYDPAKFISEKGTSKSFDKYTFINDEENIYDKGKILYVAPSWKKVDGTWLAAVNDSSNRHIFSLWEVNGEN